MTELITEPKGLKTRRGVPLYEINPFIGSAVSNTKQGIKRVTSKDGSKMFVVSGETGEIVSKGAGFWSAQEVDKTQFLKLYVNGIKALKELTQAGTKVFELLCLEIQNNIGKDQVHLAFTAINQAITPISETTYARGMRELIAKNFIAATPVQGFYFINPDFIFNGDRLAFVKEFRLAKPKAKTEQLVDDKTIDMFSEVSDD